MDPLFFPSSVEFREWLEQNHDSASELWVGYYKRHTRQPGMTWPESVDQALCFGWIDGIRKKIDEDRYQIHFSPRKPKSVWSQVNLKRCEELEALGIMHASGRKARETRELSEESSSQR